MNKEDLEKLGITDEAVQKQIIILHGKDIEKHKLDLGTATSSLETLKEEYQKAADMIKGFEAMDVEGIKTAAKEWETKAAEAQKNAEIKIQALKFDHALEKALTSAKARNAKAVKALLKIEDLKLAEDGESIEGIDDQLTAVKTENDYLFDSTPPDPVEDPKDPRIVIGGNTTQVIPDAVMSAVRKGAKLTRD